MEDALSVLTTIFGVFLELLAMIGLARLSDADLPIRTMLVTAACAITILSLAFVSLVVGLIWGTEPLMSGAAILLLLPGTSLAAFGILKLVRWLNWRDNPGRQQFNPPPPTPDDTSFSS